MHITVHGKSLELLPEKAIYWTEHKTLLVADIHLGKVSHFRKAGIGIPSDALFENYERLSGLLLHHDIEEVILLGDLFHSEENREWDMFGELIQQFPEVKFRLILGNHDILSEKKYKEIGLETNDKMVLDSFLLTHHPQEEIEKKLYNLCGHIHPGVRLRGAARQSLRLPCFYFGKQMGIMPAFGTFTGTKTIKVLKEDQVFVIANGEIIKIT